MAKFYNNSSVQFSEIGGRKYITGYAAVYYNGKSETEYNPVQGIKERIAKGAFKSALKRGDDTFALFNHDKNIILGRLSAGTLELFENEIGLGYRVPFDDQDPDHIRVMRKLMKREVTGSSIGADYKESEVQWTKEADGSAIRTYTNFQYLTDVSPVTIPAFSGTSAAAIFDTENVEAVKASYKRWLATEERFAKLDSWELGK